MSWTIEQLKVARESEDHVEFKRGEGGNVSYDGGSRIKPAERRRCILGYVVALCNEKGGTLVIGMHDRYPHVVVGTHQAENALGVMEADIYRDTGIRTKVYELFENPVAKTGRVVVIEIPPRPIGKAYKFEDVALMRVGEELKPMSDEYHCRIIQEQEPDFSQQICDGVTIEDLDDDAVQVMREKYAKKQNNPLFLTLAKEQILSDLELMVDGHVTNAALILLGKETVLHRMIPQAAVMVEYRSSESMIHFENRIPYQKPFYLMIDDLWHDINLRNGSFPVKEGAFIFNVPYFNEEVIREAINNAIAHRDYRRTSETVIKLYPQRMTIINAGGFPQGVTIENLLMVPSTPRNRLLAEVLSKTGVVERSGQGIDKIYYNTLAEGKAEPDYSNSNDFYVELSLSAIMKNRGFALFIESVQQALPDESKLSVFEIIVLTKIRDGVLLLDNEKKMLKKLVERGLVEKIGKTSGVSYILCRSYYDFTGDLAEYQRRIDWDMDQMMAIISPFLAKYNSAKIGDFVKLLEGHMTRRQIRNFTQRLVEQKILEVTGTGSGTRYSFSDNFMKSSVMVDEALRIGFEELIKRKSPKVTQKDEQKEGEIRSDDFVST